MRLSTIKRSICTFVFIAILFHSNSRAHAAYSITELGSVIDNISGSSSWFGSAIKTGDWNGDGYQDFFTSSPYISSNTGRMYVFFGGTTLDTTADVVITGENSGDVFGNDSNPGASFAVADINADGFDDIIAGAYQRDEYGTDAGKGYLFFGSDSRTGTFSASTADIFFAGNTTNMKNLGTGAMAGDFNGDGDLDIALTTRSSTTSGASIGALIIYNGDGDDTFDNTYDLLINNLETTRFTFNGMDVGDINGDGYDDIFVADTSSVTSTRNQYIYYGGAAMDSTYDLKFTAESTGDFVNRGAVEVADLNHDGYDDVCIGAYTNDTYLLNSGRLYCFFSEGAAWTGTYAFTSADIIISGAAINDNLGRTVNINDFNQDGYNDILVGIYQVDGSDDGYIQIYFGDGTTNFDTTADLTFTAANLATPVTDMNFGNSVNSGDLDNDGWVDLFLSQANGGNGTGIVGRTYIFEVTHGTPDFTIITGEATATTIEGNIADATVNISNVQWSTSNSVLGTWTSCTPDDGSFDSGNENFSCNVASLSAGNQTIYLRSIDENGVYMSSTLYETKTVTIDRASPNDILIALNSKNKEASGKTPRYTNNMNIRLYFSVEDTITDVTHMRISEDRAKLENKSFREYDDSIGWSFNKDGLKRLFVQFKDSVGNISDTYSQTITVDTLPPTITLNTIGGINLLAQYDGKLDLPYRDKAVFTGKISDAKFDDKLYIKINDIQYSGDSEKIADIYIDYKNKVWFTRELPLLRGENKVIIYAKDVAGNESSLIELILRNY